MIHSIRRPSLGSRAGRARSLGLMLTFVLAPGLGAQATGPAHAGYDPTASVGGHYHEGLTGEQALILEREMKCLCSCGMDVHSCQFQMQCDTSPGWSERIRRDLEAGQTPDAIRASFVADYGMQVLMAPPAEGFNLLGYFLPGATILVAGGLIGMLVRRHATYRPGLAPVTELDDEDAERLRSALEKLDKSESPDW